ncbi:MAG TPA: Amuc_1100 family pilus-like protein [bacterium]|nr:Amuc_1100 family pilus-like protein [bacterium]
MAPKIVAHLEKMNSIYVFRQKTLRMIIIAGTAILIGAFVWSFAGVVAYTSSARQHAELLAKLNKLVDYGKSVPTLDNIRELQKDTVTLQSHFDELESTLGRDAGGRIETAMQFKGELLKAQRSVLAKARERGVSVPEHIGIEEFIGKRIPQESDVPKLGGGIRKVKAILESLIDSGIVTISQVARVDDTPVKADAGDAAAFYIDHGFDVRFEASQDVLLKAVTAIMSSKEFLVIRNIEVRRLGDQKYAVRMIVSGIEFL